MIASREEERLVSSSTRIAAQQGAQEEGRPAGASDGELPVAAPDSKPARRSGRRARRLCARAARDAHGCAAPAPRCRGRETRGGGEVAMGAFRSSGKRGASGEAAASTARLPALGREGRRRLSSRARNCRRPEGPPTQRTTSARPGPRARSSPAKRSYVGWERPRATTLTPLSPALPHSRTEESRKSRSFTRCGTKAETGTMEPAIVLFGFCIGVLAG